MKKTKQVFDQHADCDVLFRTSDDTHFFTAHHAAAHAANLEDKRVDTCHRVDHAPNEVKTTAKASKKKTVPTKEKAKKVTANSDGKHKKLNPMLQAKADVETIAGLDTIEKVNAFVDGKTAKTVIRAAQDRIEALKAGNGNEEE